MSLDVRCEICNKFIRHVDARDLHTIKGPEVCDECFKKVGELYKECEESKGKFQQQVIRACRKSEGKIGEIQKEFDAGANEFKELLKKVRQDILHEEKKIKAKLESVFRGGKSEMNDKIMLMGRFF